MRRFSARVQRSLRALTSGALTAVSLAIAVTPPRALAQGAESITYSDEQATRGDQVFTKICQQCHTRRDMANADFRLKWNGQTVYDLYDLVRTTMPDSAPGTLSPAEYSDVTAYIMKLNGIRAGAQPMPIDSLMRRIKLDIPMAGAPSSASHSASTSLPFAPRLPMSRTLSFRSVPSKLRAATAAAALTVALPLVARAQGREAVVLPGSTPSPMLSAGVKVGNLVYSAGQLGVARTNPDTTVGGQTKVALNTIKQVFETAGSSMSQALKCTVFLIDVKDFGGMNAAYREFFPTTPPARTTVVVAALVQAGAKVEIECVAAIPGK